MEKLTSESAQSEISTIVKDGSRVLFIDSWKSEAYHQHQNFHERKCQNVKKQTNILLYITSSTEFAWLFQCAMFALL